MRRLLIIGLIMLFTTNVYAYTRQKTWVTGEIITADGLNADNDNLISEGITSSNLADNSVITAKIASNSVTTAKIAGSAVTAAEIATDAVDSAEIKAGAVGTSELEDTTVTAGAYTRSSITVDADGRLTAASSGAAIDLTADVTGTLPVGNGGTGATAASNAANGVCILDADGDIPSGLVDTLALNTTTGTTAGGDGEYTLPGGEYGFRANYKKVGGGTCQIHIANTYAGAGYTAVVYWANSAGTTDAQVRYVTTSGEDYWLFLLVEKATGYIYGGYAAPDHPSYGNGGDYELVPHPFPNYDSNTLDIVLVDQSSIPTLEGEVTDSKGILDIAMEDYKPKSGSPEVYVPLHSGIYIDQNGQQVKHLVETIPNYITVRKLVKFTSNEKSVKAAAKAAKEAAKAAAKAAKDADKASGKNKLKNGQNLTQAEVDALFD